MSLVITSSLLRFSFMLALGQAVRYSTAHLDTDGAIGVFLHLLPKSQQDKGPVPWRARWAHSRSLSNNA